MRDNLPTAEQTAGSGPGSALVDVLYLQEPGETSPISTDDINQDELGDCYLLAAIGELALLHPNMIQNMIRPGASGGETVTLYGDAAGGMPNFGTTAFTSSQVQVDNAFDAQSVNNLATQDVYAGQKEIWVQVLEQAMATTAGGYGAISNGGYPTLAMEQLTGQPASFFATGDVTLQQLQAEMGAGDLITFDTPQTDLAAGDPLVADHAYMLGGLTDQDGTEMVQLLNPWGPEDNPPPIAFSQIAAYSDFIAVGQVVDDAPPLVAAPAPPSGLALAAGSDSGAVGDDLTDDNAPQIIGQAQPGDRVSLFDDGVLAATAVVDATGAWRIDLSSLPDGRHVLTATDTNATGVASAPSQPLALTIDTSLPSAPASLQVSAGGSAIADGAISRTGSLIVTGTGVAGDVVTLRDGGRSLATATVAADGSWSIATGRLADGAHAFTAIQTNPAGTASSSSASLSVVVDTAPVVAPVLQQLVPDATGQVSLLRGAAAAGAIVTVWDGSQPVDSAVADPQSGGWSFDLSTLLETSGLHRLTATAMDAAGAVSAASSSLAIGAAAGAETVSAAEGGVVLLGGSRLLQFQGGTTPSTVSGGGGSATIFGGAGGGVFTGGSAGGNVLISQGASGITTRLTAGGDGDRLFGSAAGSDDLTAAHGRDWLIGGGGRTTFDGGQGGAVIFTGNGPSTVVGGSAGGDTVVGGAGALSVTAHGDAIFGGSGALTVTGTSSGSDSIIGGGGSLNVAGSGGNMLVAAGAGDTTVDTGNGASLVFAGAGNLTLAGGSGMMQVVAGTGSASIREGSGATILQVIAGAAGGSELLRGFRPSVDRIELFGYSQAQQTLSVQGSSTLLSLADGTRITLQAVTDAQGAILHVPMG